MRTRSSGVRDAEAARAKCLRLLERRAHSASELERRLKEAGFEQNVIEETLTALEQAGLVDDEEFARAWVSHRVETGTAGRRRLRWELQRKGIAEDLIRRVVEEGVDDEREAVQALSLARKRLREQPADRPALLRVRRLLLSRGYGFQVVESVLRRLSPRRRTRAKIPKGPVLEPGVLVTSPDRGEPGVAHTKTINLAVRSGGPSRIPRWLGGMARVADRSGLRPKKGVSTIGSRQHGRTRRGSRRVSRRRFRGGDVLVAASVRLATAQFTGQSGAGSGERRRQSGGPS